MKVITLKAKKQLNLLIEYNWEDELRDYQDTEVRKGHIFEILVALDNFTNNRSVTPAQYAKGE